ncbi:TonB-dependent receptor plug domain-containing protein [Undibacterium sp. Di24W]|uniref:TonB-dependent receptor plug domain-containing protein n=1 Tax=Undibacterium sp. Di24W TaxID=3413033 RepID=UPI003BF22C4F
MKLKKIVIALTAVGCASITGAYAQEVQDKQEKDKLEKIQRVEVTGSSIKRVNAETASPVQIIDFKQIENMGARTLLQVLDNLPAARPAQQDFRSMFTGSDGASQANLRGLGAQGTLILLNGRRLSFYGAPEGFQTQFVNIDAIPAAAIERMEVLTDGASAVYGSDAVAGVINIITKKSYNGLQASATFDSSRDVKSYGERQASALFGFGDLSQDKYNIYGSVNLYKRDRIALEDTYLKRPDQFYKNNPSFISNFRITEGSQPGQLNPGTLFVFDKNGNNKRYQQAAAGCSTFVTEGAGTRCVWNTLPYSLDTGPKSDRATLFVSGRVQLANDWEGFGEVAYTDIDMRGENGPRSFNSGGGTANWYSRNTGTTLNTFSYPYLGPNNVYLKNMSADLKAKMGGAAGLTYLMQDAKGHFGQQNTDKTYRAMAGVRGSLGQWDFESALAVAGSHSTLYQTVNVNKDGFEKAFGPFTVDPVTKRTYIADNPAYQFGVISDKNAELLRQAYPTFDIQSWTKLVTWDAKLEGSLFKMPAGDARAAFGVNLMREEFETPGNKDAADGKITQQGGSWFDGSRTIAAVFGEAIFPLAKNLEVNTAARIDKYPNFAANFAPKIGVSYRPINDLLVRSTYSQGFRAPNLAESGIGGVYAQRGGMRDTVRCDETNAIAKLLIKSVTTTDQDLGKTLLNSNCSINIGGLTPPNPNLQPEKAKISTLGLVYQASKQFDISADYWFVYRRNEIVRQDFTEVYDQAVEKYGPALIGAPNAVRAPITDFDKANMAAVASMCANAANAAACAGGVPKYSVGILAGLTNKYMNRGRTMIDGFDIDAHARFNLGTYGKLNFGSSATIMNRNAYNGDDGSGFSQNYVGYYGNPKLRANFNVDWQYGDFTSSVFVNYTGSSKWAYDKNDEEHNNPQSCTAADVAVAPNNCGGAPAYKTVNLGLGWTPVKDLRLGLNIKNILNTKPFYDPNGWEGYNHGLNLFGRVISVSASYKFM